MAVFCGRCGTRNGFPMSSVRTSRSACEYCGGFDKMNVRRDGGKIEERKLPNYSYPTRLLPSVVEQEDREIEAEVE